MFTFYQGGFSSKNWIYTVSSHLAWDLWSWGKQLSAALEPDGIDAKVVEPIDFEVSRVFLADDWTGGGTFSYIALKCLWCSKSIT